MVKTNESEEELEYEEKLDSELSEEGEEESSKNGEESTEEEEEVEEEPETVLLSDHTRTKDVLHRLAEKVIGDEDKLKELAEEDPKLLERLKSEFPKKFKDVKLPSTVITDDDIEEKINAAVAKKLESSGKSDALDALRKELGMSEMEFLDIKEDLSIKADRFLKIEVVENVKDAVLMAFNNLDPQRYKDIMRKEAAKELLKRQKNSKTSSGKSGGGKTYSKEVLDNYKKLGFKSPEELVKYQGNAPIVIREHLMS